MKYLGLKGLRITLEKAEPGFRIALTGAAFLFLALGLVYSLVAWSVYVSALPEIQYFDSTMLIQDNKGAPVGQARVVVFELADGGTRKLSEGVTDNSGAYRARLQLPRKLAREKLGMIDGAEASEVYAAVNLWVVASRVGEESGSQVVDVGTLTFSVDPTFMRHPLDSATHTVKLSRIRPQASATSNTEGSASVVGLSPQRVVASSCQIPTYPYQEESWAYTTVLKFATWDNIQASFTYVKGSKIRVESKERYFVVGTCSYTPWGSYFTIVTLDYGFSLSVPVTGRYVYNQKINLKYYFIRYWLEGAVLIEKIYAADTNRDGAEISDINKDKVGWSGSLPSWSNYLIIPQNYERPIDITGTTYGFTFSAGAGVSFYGIGFSVSLGVGMAPSPVSSLIIKAGTWITNYRVKVVSRDSTYLETYSNWVPP